MTFGTLKHPEHGYYHNHEDCRWLIDVEGPITLKFNQMDLEDKNDWLLVQSERGERYGYEYTGDWLPSDLHVNGPVEILFWSDSSVVRTGFSISIVRESQNTTSMPPTTNPIGLYLNSLTAP